MRKHVHGFTVQWLGQPQGKQWFTSLTKAQAEHARLVKAGYSCGPIQKRHRHDR